MTEALQSIRTKFLKICIIRAWSQNHWEIMFKLFVLKKSLLQSEIFNLVLVAHNKNLTNVLVAKFSPENLFIKTE